jgi:hypothetical protein
VYNRMAISFRTPPAATKQQRLGTT